MTRSPSEIRYSELFLVRAPNREFGGDDISGRLRVAGAPGDELAIEYFLKPRGEDEPN